MSQKQKQIANRKKRTISQDFTAGLRGKKCYVSIITIIKRELI